MSDPKFDISEADELADILMGIEDTRNELIRMGRERQEIPNARRDCLHLDEIQELAERWNDLANQLVHWPDPIPEEDNA